MYFAYGWPKVFSTALDSPAASGGVDGSLDDAPLSEQEVVYLTAGAEVLLLVTSSGCVPCAGPRLCDGMPKAAIQHRLRAADITLEGHRLGTSAAQRAALSSSSKRSHGATAAGCSVQFWAAGQHRVRLGVLVRGEESLASDGLNKRAFWSGSRRMLAVVVRARRPLRSTTLEALALPGRVATALHESAHVTLLAGLQMPERAMLALEVHCPLRRQLLCLRSADMHGSHERESTSP